MRKITKKLVSLGISFTLVLGLFGCGLKADKNAVETSTTSVNQPTEIVLWYTNEELSDYIENAVRVYEETNNITITTKLVSGIDYIENINQAVLSEDMAPDLFIAENNNLEKIYLAGLASESMDETLSESNYYKTALDAFTYKDKLLAYPLYFETSYLLYNQEFVQTPPSTIDEILAFSDEFDAPEGVEAIFNWDISDILSNYFFIGNYLNNDDINNENYVKDKEKLVEALTYYQNLNQYFAIDEDTLDYETAFQNFIDGKSVFTIAKTDKLPEIEMIEGDVSEEVQDDSNEQNLSSNEEGTDETKENETSKTKNETSSTKVDEETSKNNETNTESPSEESSENQKTANSLSDEFYAGIERVFRQMQTDTDTSADIEDQNRESVDTIEDETTINEEKEVNIDRYVSYTIVDKNENFKIASLPNLTNELPSQNIAINYGVFVNGYTMQREAAESFARFLTFDRAQSLYKDAGKLSSSKHVSYDNANLSAILQQFERSVSTPKVMENADFWLKLEIAFSNIWEGANVDEEVSEITQ